MITTQARCTCFIGTIGLSVSCSSSLSSWGEACCTVTQTTPCLGRVALLPVGVAWAQWKVFWRLLFSGRFPWWLPTSLPRVMAEVTVSKLLSQNREMPFCSPMSCPGHTVTIFVCAAKNCSDLGCAPHSNTRSSRFHIQACLSALCASKTASCPQFTPVPVQLKVSVGGAVLKSLPFCYQSVSLCPVPSAGGTGSQRLPPFPLAFIFQYCRQSHGSRFIPSYLGTNRRRYSVCMDPDISSYIGG